MKTKTMKKIFALLLLFMSFGVFAQQRVISEEERLRTQKTQELKDEKDPEILKQKIAQLENGTELEMSALMDYYAQTSNRAKSDEVRQKTIDRYPKGENAFFNQRNLIYYDSDGDRKEQHFLKLRADFPDRDFDTAIGYLITGLADTKKLDKMYYYLSQIEDANRRTALSIEVAPIIMKYDLPAAKALIEREMEKVKLQGNSVENRVNQGGRGRVDTGTQLKNVYVDLLTKEEKYEEALKYATELNSSGGGSKVTYAYLLSKNGQHQEALPVMEELFKSGNGTPELREAFGVSYGAVNPGKKAEDFFAGIDNSISADVRDRVMKKMVNKPAPDFQVKDVEGNIVSLSDFKGKIVMIDFWSTWCGPCKRSFPAMQIALNKYKNDPNVKFMFIHSFERGGDALQGAITYLKSNNFDFDLYMDPRDKDKNLHPAASAFGVKAIPTKFLIDGDGNIRFEAAGFTGGDEAGAAEVVEMIELARRP